MPRNEHGYPYIEKVRDDLHRYAQDLLLLRA